MPNIVRFPNLLLLASYTVATLLTGWAVGARWGHTLTAGWALFFATIFLTVHDIVFATLLLIAASKFNPPRH
ncbi:MAG: hypothetical protein FWD64_00460 [Acidobacteriaceae bacterium]|nr:hypothetical protein [Acidobacteriaceae bacterium]